MVIAIGEITIVDLSDVHIETIPPADPVKDQLWLDTSVVPNILKRWDGSKWVNASGDTTIISPTEPEMVVCEYSRSSVAYHPDTGEEIPEDTPVFVDFAAGKKGSLMVEGVTNLLTENQSSFETDTSGWFGNNTDRTRINTVAWHGSWSLKCTPTGEGVNRGVYSAIRTPVTAGESYTAQCRAMQLSGGTVKLRLRLEWWDAPTGGTRISESSYGESVTLDDTWQEIKVENKVAPEGATHVAICIYTENSVSASEEWVIDGIQLIQSSYPLPWHIGGSTRANPLKQITLPEPLPATFGIGIATKMLHAHDAADRTFWQAGDYRRLFYDVNDGKIKMCYGNAVVEIPATWDADDIVGVYGGCQDGELFAQVKVAGTLGDKMTVGAGKNLLKNTTSWDLPWDQLGEPAEDVFGGNNARKTNTFVFGYQVAYADMEKFNPDTYTFSLWVKADVAFNCEFGYRDGGARSVGALPITTEWTKITFTFTTTKVTTQGRVVYWYPNGHMMYFSHPKLEKGDIATPWTPAPEDGDTNDIYVGSRTDGSESSNAVFADFVLHDRPEDIDPEGYLSAIPGGGEE